MKIPSKNIFTGIYELYRQGYQFIGNGCDELQSDIFQMWLPGQKVICLRGEAAAKAFYDPEKMQRTAFNDYPQWRLRFAANAHDDQLNFIDEVRRFYPFAPFMGARARQSFDWLGYQIPKGGLILLDMFGTNHDHRIWEQPYRFNPGRFKERDIRPYDFLAQGGGDVAVGHRCPGEKITIALIKTALRFLTVEVRYTIPDQDMNIDLARMPALPKSKLILSNVRRSFAYAC